MAKFKFKEHKPTKVESLVLSYFGQTLSYKGQAFEIKDVRDYSGSNGMYITAIESGRVRKGDAQWVSYRFLRGALKPLGA